MSSPTETHRQEPVLQHESSSEDGTFVYEHGNDSSADRVDNAPKPLRLDVGQEAYEPDYRSPSQSREEESRLDDDLTMLQVERQVSAKVTGEGLDGTDDRQSMSLARSRSRRTDPIDEFDISTNPIHETAQAYKPPENPSTAIAKFFKRLHETNWLVRWFTYIVPCALLLLTPILVPKLHFPDAGMAGVQVVWFGVWVEIFWLTLWAGRLVAKIIPWPVGVAASVATNNAKKWRDMSKQLEIPATLFFWWLAIVISWPATLKNHLTPDRNGVAPAWIDTTQKVWISVFVGIVLNLVEKIIIQLIAISFHLRTYADRIEMNKFQIASLVKLYIYSKDKIGKEDSEFEDRPSGGASGARTPMQYVEQAQRGVMAGVRKAGDAAGKIAGDFTGRQVMKSTHPNQVVLQLLNSTSGSQVLARRLYRTFLRSDAVDSVDADDLRNAFEDDNEADAAFVMFDKDLNGDITMDELEAVCVEIGRERKSITASLKDLDSVVSKLDGILVFVVCVVTILVFVSLISIEASGVLTSAGSSILALSWLFSATAQEFLQSIVFVFVKHPFDVGDRVSIYGNTGSQLKGDDYFVKEISLLYTEFKKMEGQVVQAPNSYLNGLFILNMRRSGGLAEAVPMVVKFGTTLEQIEALKEKLLDYVKAEKREYQGNILIEVRDVTEAYSVTINVVFFYKSNWQNELLRLTRRNRFICALMLAMQEVGMETPRAGQRPGFPLYINQQNGPGVVEAPTPRDPGDRPLSTVREEPLVPGPSPSTRIRGPSVSMRPHPSILRRRGDSVSSIAKRVDFSFGAKDVASDPIGDVYDDVSQPSMPRIRSISHKRKEKDRELRESLDRERSESVASASGRDTSVGPFALKRVSTSDSRPSMQRTIHRNRFFGAAERGDPDFLAEEGMAPMQNVTNKGALSPSVGPSRIEERTGLVSSQAIRHSTSSSNNESDTTQFHSAPNHNSPTVPTTAPSALRLAHTTAEEEANGKTGYELQNLKEG